MAIIQAPPRTFISQDLQIKTWEDIAAYLLELENREISNEAEFEIWLEQLSELEAVLEEDMARRYIRMTIDTRDEDALQSYTAFVTGIQPHLVTFSDKLNRKLANIPFSKSFNEKGFSIYLRKIIREIEIFREINVPILTELQQLAQEFGAINGKMSIEIGGKRMTMQQAAAELQSTDRLHREEVYRLMTRERLAASDQLDSLFNQLVEKRNQLAVNAGFENFRDYQFAALARFDYNAEDCKNFHESIRRLVVPISAEIQAKRKADLKVDALRPWDLSVDPKGRSALKPFKSADDLLKGCVAMFEQIDPYFGECLQTMADMGYLDLASKEGKAPGGYNYPLYETGVPFIFMNAVGTPRDLVTMVHEGGHAIHSFYTRDLHLTSYKSCPSEVAELASMSMELLSMDFWGIFYKNQSELVRAKKEQLEDVLLMLPWIALIDRFQHWIYENPKHSEEERRKAWLQMQGELSPEIVDWSGFEDAKANAWQKQLHLFEVPFYYIEYGMAQLGAIAVWRNYRNNPSKAIEQFKDALKLGYTASIAEIYAAAGIKFDFSENYLTELAAFVKSELGKLED